MSIFVQGAATAVAQALKAAGVWVAWGNGDSAWDAVPVAEPIGATALVAERGRRRASVIDYVVPDVAGTIVLPQGTFSISPTPTNQLYVRCNFNATEEVGQAIREAAVFIGTTLVGGLPVGQDYFVPANIATPGTMLILERFAKITRTSSFSVSLEFVLTL
jgi:hypothetical protein